MSIRHCRIWSKFVFFLGLWAFHEKGGSDIVRFDGSLPEVAQIRMEFLRITKKRQFSNCLHFEFDPFLGNITHLYVKDLCDDIGLGFEKRRLLTLGVVGL